MVYVTLGIGSLFRQRWSHKSCQENSFVGSIWGILSQLQIWRYVGEDVYVFYPSDAYCAADIANNVLYMVGLDGGLIPDDGDASSKSKAVSPIVTWYTYVVS